MPINTEYYELIENGIKNKTNSIGKRITEFKIKKGQTIKFGLLLFSKPTQDTTFTFYKSEDKSNFDGFTNFQTYKLNQIYERTFTATEDMGIYIMMWGNSNSEIFEFQLWAEYDKLTDYEKHQEESYILDIQQKMLQNDYFVKEEDGWKEVHGWTKIVLDGINNKVTPDTTNTSGKYRYRFNSSIGLKKCSLSPTVKITTRWRYI